MWQVIIEHQIGNIPRTHLVWQRFELIQQMGFKPDLSPNIGDDLSTYVDQCVKHPSGKFGPAQSCFPTDKLRQNTCGNTVGRQFNFCGTNAFTDIFHRTAPWGYMPFKSVTMHIDDARQHAITLEVYRPASRCL